MGYLDPPDPYEDTPRCAACRAGWHHSQDHPDAEDCPCDCHEEDDAQSRAIGGTHGRR